MQQQKELYSPENCHDLLGDQRFQFRPADSALLILDMQRFFLAADSHAFIPAAANIVPGICTLIEAYRTAEKPVIFTRHINTDDNAGLMKTWWRDMIRSGDASSEIIGELDTSAGVVIEKSQYDAFYQTDLEQVLREQSVRQVVICGVMTNLCCETTARSAFVRGFEVFFPIDGAAAYNGDYHRGTLSNLAFGVAVLTTVERIVEACGGQ